MGENVAYKRKVKNIGKAIKKIKKDYTHVAMLGSNEENGEDIKIKSLNTDETIIIESPNKKDNIKNKTEEEEER